MRVSGENMNAFYLFNLRTEVSCIRNSCGRGACSSGKSYGLWRGRAVVVGAAVEEEDARSIH